MQHHVVYRYTCNKPGCKSTSYAGYTTCTLGERFRIHTQNGSIIKHLHNVHKGTRVTREELLRDVTVVVCSNEEAPHDRSSYNQTRGTRFKLKVTIGYLKFSSTDELKL